MGMVMVMPCRNCVNLRMDAFVNAMMPEERSQ